jgi:hypothetical protein
MINNGFQKNGGLFLGFLAGIVLVGCSVHAGTSSDDQNGGIVDQSLSYNLTENGCETKQHDFSSHADYCNGLESDSLNNGCAIDLRTNLYHNDCGTNFQEN